MAKNPTDAEKFLEMLEKDDGEIRKKLTAVEHSMVNVGKEYGLTFSETELDEAIENRCKSSGSRFLTALGFSEVPGF